ncbi:pyruvate phosphate dikinase [Desulfurella multipotens]|uniref:Pyruvate, phosphate dikinase n=1 Tax=Desulfurella multipotens TaxID=79269 RepID=A0A1G6HV10_9BACT|nr:pyruvate, phosphate dikinase [Desulfurella multipotens]SDB98030.1 pyruvate phosphate dikinase [Desulfurella multipotens]
MKFVYFFGNGFAEGNGSMKDILGGKGAGLAEMALAKIPVPPGFTISAEVCDYYYKNNKTYPPNLKEEVEQNLKRLEEATGKKFGDKNNPLLVSVRSGAKISMPGMMDTILNLGLNDETVIGLAKSTNNERFALDSYRRFIQMFGDVAVGIDKELFEDKIKEIKKKENVKFDHEISIEGLKWLIKEYKKIYDLAGKSFPQDPFKQLWIAIDAVFNSWMNKRAIDYRRINKIKDSDLLGTAVSIVSMVFGNMGDDSGTGVAFTRDPSTGEKKRYGEFLVNAQGEDVVAGIRNPYPLEQLKQISQEAYDELLKIFDILEAHYKDMQDVEFTVERKKLYMLQTRSAKRTAKAAVKVAKDMVEEGLITKEEAISRISTDQIDQLLHPSFDEKAKKSAKLIAKGLGASPGAASGKVVFSAQKAEEIGQSEPVILVRHETSAEDVAGMAASVGILTAQGGRTSHAAVVARGMGKSAVVGCEEISIDYKNLQFSANGTVVKELDTISIDGSTGEVFLGEVKTIKPSGLDKDLSQILQWADEVSRMYVRANADTPQDAKVALEFGAKGIGLCRTEHMFFAPDRINTVREMIVSKDTQTRQKALDKLMPMQKEDFKALFRTMKGLEVTIRLIDPPLHEFLPQTDSAIEEVARNLNISVDELKDTIKNLHEFNPMLGHRGCRLTITYPEIAIMQTKAIILAALELKQEGIECIPEIMIPLVGIDEEIKYLKNIIKQTADELIHQKNTSLTYLVGTMIEIPRACTVADEIAKEADFFSFGTNDLTQMTFGFSRDDAGRFLFDYLAKGILKEDPFKTIDTKGVGTLMKMAVEKGKIANKSLRLGICGEHGGDPESIEFVHSIGLDYVSCSPYRVPVARLACAQATINKKADKD